MKKQLVEIEIGGEIVGELWMEGKGAVEFVKRFHPTKESKFRKKWSGLKPAIEAILKPGDFQSCKIREAYLKATYRIDSKRELTITSWLKPCKLLDGMFE